VLKGFLKAFGEIRNAFETLLIYLVPHDTRFPCGGSVKAIRDRVLRTRIPVQAGSFSQEKLPVCFWLQIFRCAIGRTLQTTVVIVLIMC
jgi:hypothetical protein